MPTLNEVARQAWQDAHDAGWHDDRPDKPAATHVERIALIHSEVSEALEAWRRSKGRCWFEVDGKPEGIGSELADVIIRTAELAEWLGIDLDGITEAKMAYNRHRRDTPARDGGKVI